MTRMRALAVVAMLGALSVWHGAAAADPAANRKASAAYDADVRGNPAFRANRAHTECDPIESLDLRAQCVASFDQAIVTVGAPPPPAAGSDPLHPVITVTNGPVQNPGD